MNRIQIEVEKNEYNDLVKYLIKNNIYFDYLDIKNKVTLIININDFKEIKTLFKNIKIKKYYGLNKIKNFLKKHYILIISFILVYLLLLILSNVIFNIEIISNNKDLKTRINLYLEENGIKKYKFMKTNEELNKIKKIILEENKNTLEWIEIERIGTKYKIELTERVINEENSDNTPRNLIAKKDALIKYIVTEKGTKIKEVNELVKKGDIIISGEVIQNEEVKNIVSAKGKVYGEVWYTVNVTVPFTHVHYEKTGDVINHIYMDVFGKKITLIGQFKTNKSMNTKKVILDKPYLFFKIVSEQKELYDYTTHTLTEKEALTEAIKRSDKSINDKLNENEYIIEKKVLKNNTYSSKIELEIFYRVYESIESYQNIEEIKEGE